MNTNAFGKNTIMTDETQTTDAMIWASRVINAGSGRRPNKFPTDMQHRCMQAALDQAYEKGPCFRVGAHECLGDSDQ
jgi:hypothetical protein